MDTKKSEIFTIPNLLSVVRVLLIPLFMSLYFNSQTTAQYYTAAVVILISGLTDLLDGVIARKFNQVSEIGKALDPIADKLTQAGILICLISRYKTIIPLVCLFVGKELYMGIMSLILLRKGKKLDGAKWFGKVSTAVFYLCMVCLVAFPALPLWAVNTMIVVTGLCLLYSLISYIPEYNALYRQAKEE